MEEKLLHVVSLGRREREDFGKEAFGARASQVEVPRAFRDCASLDELRFELGPGRADQHQRNRRFLPRERAELFDRTFRRDPTFVEDCEPMTEPLRFFEEWVVKSMVSPSLASASRAS